jgi:2-dehydropantoate 2-reductase
MRIAVVGAGAVGGYFGGRLAKAGNEVWFVARGKHLQALRAHGLHVESPKGDFVVQPVQSTNDPAEIGHVDVILLCVKAWQVLEAAPSLHPMIATETCVLPVQNGVEAPNQLASVLGKKQVLGGLCRIISMVVEPGKIRHLGAEPYVALGELDNRPSERVRKLRETLAAAGIKAEIPPDIQVATWEKFLFISAVSGVGAVTRAPIGVIRRLPETRRMLEQAMQEIFNVGQAHHIALSSEIIRKTVGFIDGLPADGTASMQRDIMEGRPSELEAQNGAVVRLGLEAGVETPLNAFIYHSLLPMERKARNEL